jgi:hypothetical protein
MKTDRNTITSTQEEIELEISLHFTSVYGNGNNYKITFPCKPPTQYFPTETQFLSIASSLNTKKAFGDEFVPLELVNDEVGLRIVYSQLKKVFSHQNLFRSRLVCLNKLKDKSVPTKQDIRPIAI